MTEVPGGAALRPEAHVDTLAVADKLLGVLTGVYHSVSAKHLQDYVNEFAYRYNHRSDQTPMYGLISAQVRNVRQGKHGQYAPLG